MSQIKLHHVNPWVETNKQMQILPLPIELYGVIFDYIDALSLLLIARAESSIADQSEFFHFAATYCNDPKSRTGHIIQKLFLHHFRLFANFEAAQEELFPVLRGNLTLLDKYDGLLQFCSSYHANLQIALTVRETFAYLPVSPIQGDAVTLLTEQEEPEIGGEIIKIAVYTLHACGVFPTLDQLSRAKHDQKLQYFPRKVLETVATLEEGPRCICTVC